MALILIFCLLMLLFSHVNTVAEGGVVIYQLPEAMTMSAKCVVPQFL